VVLLVVRGELAVEFALFQLVPTTTDTSNQYLFAVKLALVHDVPVTALATAENPVVAEVTES
jgi:hypothetical protein